MFVHGKVLRHAFCPVLFRPGICVFTALIFFILRIPLLERPLHPDEQHNLVFHVLGYDMVRLKQLPMRAEGSQSTLTQETARAMLQAWQLQPLHQWHAQSWSRTMFYNEDGNNSPPCSALARLVNTAWQVCSRAEDTRFHVVALRLPALIAACLACAAFAWMATGVLGFTRGMVAALLLAVHPLFIEFSVMMRGYSLMLAAQIAAWCFYRAALAPGGRRSWIGGAACNWAAVWCFPGYAYAAVPLELWLGWQLWRSYPKAGFRQWLAAHLIAACAWTLIALPAFLGAAALMSGAYPYPSENASWPLRLFATATAGVHLPTLDALPLRSYAPFLGTIWQTIVQQPAESFVAWLALPLLIVIGWWRLRSMKDALTGFCAAAWLGACLSILHQGVLRGHELMPWHAPYLLPAVGVSLAAVIPRQAPPLRQAAWGTAMLIVFITATFPTGVRGRRNLYPPESNHPVGYVHRGLRFLSVPSGVNIATP